MGKQSTIRGAEPLRRGAVRRWQTKNPPLRNVPSNRGVALVFVVTSCLGAALGFVLHHFIGRC